MTAYLGALTVGLILAILALGLVVTYRVFRQLDLTTDGSFALGACLTAALIVDGKVGPVAATLGGVLGGMLAGVVTSVVTHRLRVAGLLAGILTTTGLLSITVIIMGQGNLPLLSDQTPTVVSHFEQFGRWLFDGQRFVRPFGPEGSRLSTESIGAMLCLLAIAGGTTAALAWFFRTHLGLAIRATGDSPQMACAQGITPSTAHLLGLALANGLVALAGSLLAQYQGFADYQMGVGVIVTGLASLMIGEALFGRRHFAWLVLAALTGAVLYRLIIALAINEGNISPNALRLITAGLVLAALVLPQLLRRRSEAPA